MKLNKKGMTLIEIIVVLVISSLILVVAGTIILNGFGYFEKTDRADKDKLAVDKIAELVWDELVYTSDVRIETYANRPNVDDPSKKWHWISVVDGRIMKDDQPLYSDDYYQNRKLKLDARLYQNDYRMDLIFSFLDAQDSQVYKTSSTLELINLKSELINASTNHTLANISKDTDYRIYYKTGDYTFVSEEEVSSKSDGTVADEIKCKDANNDKGVWQAFDKNGAPKVYNKYEFVQYPDENGSWYRLMGSPTSSGIQPDKGYGWTKIDHTYQEGGFYAYKDIVIFNGKYYQVTTPSGNGGHPPTVGGHWRGPFESVDALLKSAYPHNKPLDMTPEYFQCPIEAKDACTGTILDKIYKMTKETDKGLYEPTMVNNTPTTNSKYNTIKEGDYIRSDWIEVSNNKWEKQEEYWYIALDSNNTHKYIPGSLDSSIYWQRIVSVKNASDGIAATYSNNNSYVTQMGYGNKGDYTSQFAKTGDIIFSQKQNKYFRASYEGSGMVGGNPDDVKYEYAWTEISKGQLDESIKQCELNRK